MFNIEYEIVETPYNDFFGQMGRFNIVCNGNSYGSICPEDILCLFNWFERLLRVLEEINRVDSLALSDTDSFNVWITFAKKGGDQIVVREVHAEKRDGSRDIEHGSIEPYEVLWESDGIPFEQFRNELLIKSKKYFETIFQENPNNPSILNAIKILHGCETKF